MALPTRRIVLIAIPVLALVLIGWWIHGRSPEVQAPATFERIKAAVEGNDAAGVVDELHPRYDFAAMWPHYFGSSSEAANALGSDSSPRTLARRGIAVIFLQRGDNHLRFAYRIRTIKPQADGTVLVDATIEVGSQSGGGRLVAPDEHHWVMARDGWLLGRLRIVSHDPIDISL